MPQPIPHGWTTERLRSQTGRSWADWQAMLADDPQGAQRALFSAIQGAERPGMSVTLRDALEGRLRDDWGAWNLYNQRYGYGANPPTETANFADWISSMISGGGAAARPNIMRQLGQWATGEGMADAPERERARLWRASQENAGDPYSAMNVIAEAFGMAPIVRASMMQGAPSYRSRYGAIQDTPEQRRRREAGFGDYYSWLIERMRGVR